jgi:hypothetical protein
MQRKTLLALLALIPVLASALLCLLPQLKAPSQPVTQPAVSATKPRQARNATQAQTQPTYEIVNGWFHVKGDMFGFYVKMPPWKKLKIYVNYTARVFQGAEMLALLTVIVRNGPVYLDVGTYLGTVPTTVFTIDRGLVDLYASALARCNNGLECMDKFFNYEKDFYKYVTCYNLAWNEACTPGKVMQGPSDRLEVEDWQTGDLLITGHGEMWIKVEVAE